MYLDPVLHHLSLVARRQTNAMHSAAKSDKLEWRVRFRAAEFLAANLAPMRMRISFPVTRCAVTLALDAGSSLCGYFRHDLAISRLVQTLTIMVRKKRTLEVDPDAATQPPDPEEEDAPSEGSAQAAMPHPPIAADQRLSAQLQPHFLRTAKIDVNKVIPGAKIRPVRTEGASELRCTLGT